MGKNVLILIEHLSGGGAERIAAELSLTLEKRGHNVCLVNFEDRGTNYQHCSDHISLDLPGTGNYFLKAANLFKRSKQLKKIKREKNIDVSISFMENANLVNVLSRYKDKAICSIRTVPSNVSTGKISAYVQKMSLKRADHVVALSEYVRQDLIRNFSIEANKINTIYNTCHMKPDADLKKEDDGKFSVITVGRMVNFKGQWHLIRVFEKLHKKYPDTKLCILGQGVLEQQLKELANKLGLEKAVRFPGFVKSPEREYVNADVFALTSLWEGFGNVIVEAMACGLPVVCPQCPGGPKEILCGDEDVQIEKGTMRKVRYGILYSPFKEDDFRIDAEMPLDESELALLESLEMLYLNRELCAEMSRLSVERASHFNSDRIANDWEELLNQCLAKKSS